MTSHLWLFIIFLEVSNVSHVVLPLIFSESSFGSHECHLFQVRMGKSVLSMVSPG